MKQWKKSSPEMVSIQKFKEGKSPECDEKN